MHTFLVEQPEVNWRNPAVEEAQLKMVRGWLDRGVDGFRLDVFNIFLKDPDMPSNPELADVAAGTSAWDRQEHKYDRDQPDFPELIARFRAIVDEVPGRMSVGELFYGGPETSASLSNQNHLVFDWELVRAPWSAAEYRALLDRRQAIFGDTWPTVVLSNHDQSRHASRLSESAGIDDTDAVARASAAVLLTLRGTPFLYYGEEIGLRDVEVPFDEIIDPPCAPGGRRLGLVEPRRLSIPDAVDGSSPVTGSPPAVRGSASVTTPTRGTWLRRHPIHRPCWPPTSD